MMDILCYSHAAVLSLFFLFSFRSFLHKVSAFLGILIHNKMQLATVVPIVVRQQPLVTTQEGMAGVERG